MFEIEWHSIGAMQPILRRCYHSFGWKLAKVRYPSRCDAMSIERNENALSVLWTDRLKEEAFPEGPHELYDAITQ